MPPPAQPLGPFDAKTATKVPAGTTPEAFLKAYHEDVIAGKYDEAYKMLPLDKQKSYGDAKSYAEQVKGYGITGYKLGKPVEQGDTHVHRHAAGEPADADHLHVELQEGRRHLVRRVPRHGRLGRVAGTLPSH